jgi:hypothetical protein
MMMEPLLDLTVYQGTVLDASDLIVGLQDPYTTTGIISYSRRVCCCRD